MEGLGTDMKGAESRLPTGHHRPPAADGRMRVNGDTPAGKTTEISAHLPEPLTSLYLIQV